LKPQNYPDLVFLRLVIPLIAGILLFDTNTSILDLTMAIGCQLVLLIGLLSSMNHFYKRIYTQRIKPFISFGLYLFPFLLGGWLTLLNNEIRADNHFSKIPDHYLQVIIDDEPQMKGNVCRFPAKVIRSFSNHKQHVVSGHLLIALIAKEKSLKLNYGDQLIIPGNYKPIEEPKNPFEFNTKDWYKHQNIHHQAFLQPDQIIIQHHHQGNPIINWALQIRKVQVDLFRKRIKQEEAYTIASTLLLGYRTELSEDTLMAYSRTGTIHALSVSGMHVGLIYLIINFLLSFLNGSKPGKLIKVVLSICLIWLYALITGLSPSVLRSAIMISVFIIGNAFNQNKNSYNLLAFSAFLILIYNPQLIYDLGFQLSYLSVLGLIYLQPLIYAWFSFKYIWADKLWSFIALSLAAQTATFPLSVYYFHQFPLYFLLSNLFILVPVTLIMYLGILVMIFPMDIFVFCLEWLLKFNNNGLRWFADLPYASISKIWFSKLDLFLITVAILFLCLALGRFNKYFMILSIGSLGVLSLSLALKRLERSQQKNVIFFSLKKGHAIAFIDKESAWIYSSLNPDSKAIKHYINPAIDQSHVTFVTYINPHSELNTRHLKIKNHQINFYHYKILVADSCFNGKTLNNHVTIDALAINESAKFNLTNLLKNLKVKMIFFEAGITNYRMDSYKNVAKDFDLPTYDLRIKKAYLINLKK